MTPSYLLALIINDLLIGLNNGVNSLFFWYFRMMYKLFPIKTVEDAFQNIKNKKVYNADGKLQSNMNCIEVNTTTLSKQHYSEVYASIKEIMKDSDFLKRFGITEESIYQHTNDVISVSLFDDKIIVKFNHYYISGKLAFSIMSKILTDRDKLNKSVTFLDSNPLLGFFTVPKYIYYLSRMKKKFHNVRPREEMDSHFISEPLVTSKKKRFAAYLQILESAFTFLNKHNSKVLAPPMKVGLTLGFNELDYMYNNVGLILFDYEYMDTVDDIERKIKENMYQAYASNFLLQVPFSSCLGFEMRNYVDCILSSMYIHSDKNIEVAWYTANSPVEKLYIGSLSLMRSNGDVQLNTSYSTASMQCHVC